MLKYGVFCSKIMFYNIFSITFASIFHQDSKIVAVKHGIFSVKG